MRSTNRSTQRRNRSHSALRPRDVELRETRKARNSTSKGFTSRKLAVDKFPLYEATFGEKVAQKAIIIVVVIAIAIFFILVMERTGLLNPQTGKLKSLVEGAGPWGPVVLIAFITIGMLLMLVPALPAGILAGVLYGRLLGTIYVYIGVMLAASIAFFIARYFRTIVIRWLGEHAQVLVRFQEKYVSAAVFITRAIPIFSFEIMSYASGLTSISYTNYIVATALGILVPLILVTNLSSAIASSAGVLLPILTATIMILFFFIVPIAIDHYNPFGWKDKLLSSTRPTKSKAKR